eukprot:COSAG04_NODE_221_length_19708_cov_36.796930_10_plen_81_part_00
MVGKDAQRVAVDGIWSLSRISWDTVCGREAMVYGESCGCWLSVLLVPPTTNPRGITPGASDHERIAFFCSFGTSDIEPYA